MTDNATPPKDTLQILTYVVYGCCAAGFLIPFAPLIGVIIAAIKRKDAAGTIYESHYTWIIRTFLIGLAGALASAVLLVIPFIHALGMLMMGAVGLWGLYRLIKGALRLLDSKPIEDPKAFL